MERLVLSIYFRSGRVKRLAIGPIGAFITVMVILGATIFGARTTANREVAKTASPAPATALAEVKVVATPAAPKKIGNMGERMKVVGRRIARGLSNTAPVRPLPKVIATTPLHKRKYNISDLTIGNNGVSFFLGRPNPKKLRFEGIVTIKSINSGKTLLEESFTFRHRRKTAFELAQADKNLIVKIKDSENHLEVHQLRIP